MKPLVTECEDAGAGAETRTLSQRLTVLSVEADHLVLRIDRATACAGCAARAGCGASGLAEMAKDGLLTVARTPDLAVAPGDQVQVSLPAAPFLAAAAMAFLLPSLAMAAAALMLQSRDLPEPLVSTLCLAVLALAFLPLRWAERRGKLLSKLRVDPTLSD